VKKITVQKFLQQSNFQDRKWLRCLPSMKPNAVSTLTACFFTAVAFKFSNTNAHALLGIILPVYTESSAQYNAGYLAVAKVPFIAIINPDDGPGSGRVSSLSTFSNTVRARGGRVVGYVNSFYGGLDNSSGGDGQVQMNRYVSWYGVNGFFIDEVSNSGSYYRTLKSRGGNRFTILNPGTNIGHSLDMVVTFENPLTGAGGSGNFLNYNSNLTGSSVESGAIVYSASGASTMRSCVDHAIAQGYDWIYVSNDGGTNPFDSVPSYWQEEIDYIAYKNLPPPLSSDAFNTSTLVPTNGGWTLSFPTAAGRTYEVQASADLATWVTATAIANDSLARALGNGGQMSFDVKPLPGVTRCYFRGADITTAP
jgi:hypothetical protein